MASETESSPPRSVDPQLWRACAGAAAGGRIPVIGSRVFYFPRGHAEQSSSLPDLSAFASLRAAVLCRVAAVRLLANPDTDEVCASITLDPRLHTPVALAPEKLLSASFASPLEIADGGEQFLSFSKILTASDANNGGGFSVPRFCADSIFPPLNFDAEPPVQIISVRDVHGKPWSFRHIYRGTPRRHLLTTGWSKFVNSKKLVTGDSVVFMKNLSGQLFVGIRRTSRSCGPVHYSSSYESPSVAAKTGERLHSGEGFSRNVRGRVPLASIVEAVRSAGMGLPFEVLYYPRAGSQEFVVAVETVEAAMRVRWTTGMRVKMSVETEDSARITWFEGTVASVAKNAPAWRMLEINWDEPEVLQNVRNVSPWQLELVPASTQERSFSLKRFKVQESSEVGNDAENNILSKMMGLKSKTYGCLPPSLFSYNVFPAGMQGARHNSFFIPNSRDGEISTNQTVFSALHGLNASQKSDVSIELNIGGTYSQSGVSCPPSRSGIQVLGKRILEPAIDPAKKASTESFQLFGQVIHTKQITNGDADRLVTQCPTVTAVGACQ
ncbi:hypothetical protein Cni_G21068 [Canna indica]|uniref:Auxin response factor n=1 Tax=Canna indica TaxID=4628 RepID=A0AAQ3KV38_9LILI|nr:hypothetical protein Cni_G21068 [Canna indica]